MEVYAYPTNAQAAADSALVSSDGTTIGMTSIMWVATPHLYLSADILALYVGDDQAALEILVNVLGEPFAGGR